MTRDDYAALIGINNKKRRRRKNIGKRKPQKGGNLDLGNIKKNLPYLQLISNLNLNKKQKNALIETMNNQQNRAVQNLFQCFLQSRFKVPKATLHKLAQNKNKIYTLASNGKLQDKKKILRQQGGFILASLIPLIAKTILPGFLGKLFG